MSGNMMSCQSGSNQSNDREGESFLVKRQKGCNVQICESHALRQKEPYFLVAKGVAWCSWKKQPKGATNIAVFAKNKPDSGKIPEK